MRKLDEQCEPRLETLIDHQRCVDRVHSGVPLNTRTCLVLPFVWEPDHDNCGIDCPGPDSIQVTIRRNLLRVPNVGDDRPNRGN